MGAEGAEDAGVLAVRKGLGVPGVLRWEGSYGGWDGRVGDPGALRDGTGVLGMLWGRKGVLGVPRVPEDGMGVL